MRHAALPHRAVAVGAALLFAGAGCRTPIDPRADALSAEVPGTFSAPTREGAALERPGPWWQYAVADADLDALMQRTLGGNFELAQAVERMRAAEASARAAGAPLWPQLNLEAGVQQLEIDQRGGGGAAIPVRLGELYSLGPSLSYEVDLFGRIDATRDAAAFSAHASAADVRATGLALTGSVMTAWLDVVENTALARAIDAQVTTNTQLLDLARAQFAGGSGTALAILQQERQREATVAELPDVKGALERAQYQLAVLTGTPPTDATVALPAGVPELPPLPELDVPSALFEQRPDLVAATLRVRALDRNVAAAIADRYPRLTLTGSYNFDGNEVSLLFDRTIRVILANLTLPVLDGGARRAEVARTRAALEESIAALNQAFLVALREVEDALSRERRGVERLEALERQLALSREEVEQARRSFVGGRASYLPVLTAIQSLQITERTLVIQRVAALRARADLLRALGGALEDDAAPARP